MKINQTKQVPVEAKTLSLCLKVCDQFTCCLLDADRAMLYSHDDYVPDFMPGEHYGDYVMLDIDIDTGQITNWKQPTQEQIERFIGGVSND